MITLRSDQSPLIASVREAMQQYRSVLMQAPTGWGKTVVFSWLASQVQARSKSVIIVVHRDELLDQVSRTLAEFQVPHGFIASDRYECQRPVMVASIWTLTRRLAEWPRPDLLIVDEAHHAVAKTWAKLWQAWPNVLTLGVTATPARMNGAGLNPPFQVLIEGPSVADMIEAGHLSRYKLYAPPIEKIDVAIRAGDYAKEALAVFMDKPRITGSAVAHYERLAAGRRCVVFCVSLDHAAHVAEEFKAAGYAAARIDGKMERTDRRALVDSFSAGRTQILTSCEVVSEGFDLPAIECAILLRPTQSLGLYLQQVGRALRPYPGKDHAIILDHAGNALRHGLPDDQREWSLDGKPRDMRRTKEPVEAVRTCPKCFAAARLTCTVCPYCAEPYPVKPREVKQVEGELVELQRVEKRREQGRAQTLDELVKVGQERGYKNAGFWARRVWEGRRHG